MLEPLDYAFFQRALLAALLASVACGIVGSYVVVRRIASISGGLSHAAFGGVGLGYLLGFEPMVGAAAFALGCGAGLGVAERRMRSGLDTLIAMVWAVGMALGILFVSLTPGYAPDLMSYLFGSILFVSSRDVMLILALDAIIVAAVAIYFRQFRAVAFDEEFAEVSGLRVRGLLQGMLVLTALAVVILIRVVGVILVIALLTIPAAVARQWSEGLLKMMVLATLIGALCSVSGLYLSYWLSAGFGVHTPTGPLIILLAIALYGVSGVARRLLVKD